MLIIQATLCSQLVHQQNKPNCFILLENLYHTVQQERKKTTPRSRFGKDMKCQNNKGGKIQNMSTTEKQSEEVEGAQRFHNHLVTTENLLPVCNLLYKTNFKKRGTLCNDNQKGTQPLVRSSEIQHIHLAPKHKNLNIHFGLLQLNINNWSPLRAKSENNLISHHMVTRTAIFFRSF